MTLIAAIFDNKRVAHMIGDRRITNSADDILNNSFPKIAHLNVPKVKEKILIGASGLQPLVMVCTQLFIPPSLPKDKTISALNRWCMTDLRKKLRDDLLKESIFRKDKEGESAIPGVILMSVRGRHIIFGDRFYSNVLHLPYYCIGGGDDYCLGALHHLLRKQKKSPTAGDCKKYLLEAMRSTIELKAGIGPPFDYINSNGEQEIIKS